jgi:myo-inositol-1(or 4)-monophosphatase
MFMNRLTEFELTLEEKELIHKFLKKAEKVIKEAGKIIEKAFYEEVSVEYKKKDELISGIYKKVEMIIKKGLEEFGFSFDEEKIGKENKNSNFLIVLDPIDGITNFYYKIGFFATTLALVYKGNTVLGVVYNPLTKEFYHAILGEGAYLNGKKIEAKMFKNLKNAIIGFCHSNKEEDISIISDLFKEIRPFVKEFRKFGSVSLEMVYSINKFQGFLGIGLKVYDFKAAYLIAKEAGLFTTNKVIRNNNDILVINKGIKDEFMEFIESYLEGFEL